MNVQVITIQGKEYITTKIASSLSGYDSSYIQKLARQNKIKSIRIGRNLAIEKHSIIKYADNVKTPAVQNSLKMRLKAMQLGHELRTSPDCRVHCIHCGESITNIYKENLPCQKQ